MLQMGVPHGPFEEISDEGREIGSYDKIEKMEMQFISQSLPRRI